MMNIEIKKLFFVVVAGFLFSPILHADEKNKEPYVGYLAAYMTGADEKNLYYAISTDGFKFDQLVKGGAPILSATMDDKLVRDPMVFRDQKGVYHLVATVSWKNRPFTIWDSTDLVNWKNERLVDVAPENATKTWAPELAYDKAGDQYFVYWTSDLNKDFSTASIYYATTKDFKTFSKPAILYSTPGTGILDATLVNDKGLYRLIYRCNGIWQVTSKNALGPYTNLEQVSDENVEGPYVFPLNSGKGWGIVWDYYKGSQGFGLFTTNDFKKWERITNPSAPYYNNNVWFPDGIRHGSITPLTQQQLNTITNSLGVTSANKVSLLKQ